MTDAGPVCNRESKEAFPVVFISDCWEVIRSAVQQKDLWGDKKH